MVISRTSLPGVLVLQPKVFVDERGYFLETYNRKEMAEAGIQDQFVQDNHSFSMRRVLRGLHYQRSRPQGKLIRTIAGEVFDVVVDLRRSSPAFGKWYAVQLSDENKKMLWVPPGLAHGFLACSETAHVLYKTTEYYMPELERTLAWNDPTLNIAWPIGEGNPIVSSKDQLGVRWQEAETFA